MATALMDDDVGRLHAAVGFLRAEVQNLFDKFERLEEITVTEQRKVHDIVVAQSEAVRNLDRDVREIKPLVEDYRERRAEWRGAWKLILALYVTIGAVITMALSKLFDWLTTLGRPH